MFLHFSLSLRLVTSIFLRLYGFDAFLGELAHLPRMYWSIFCACQQRSQYITLVTSVHEACDHLFPAAGEDDDEVFDVGLVLGGPGRGQ